MDIDNDKLLEDALMNDLESTVNNIANTILNEVKDNIQRIVYDPYQHDVFLYDRLGENGGFIGSWIIENLPSDPRNIECIIYSDPNLIIYDADKYQHGNLIEDRTKMMSEVIAEGWGYDFEFDHNQNIGWWVFPRDYWTPSNELIKDPFLEKSVGLGMKMRGWEFP